MIAYKTNGDWEDVTSMGRNDIVFEGRNKEYGAYVVRQRYKGALLLSLLIAGSFGALCAAIPLVIHYFSKPAPADTKTKTTVLVTPLNYIDHTRHVMPPPPAPIHHSAASTNRNTPPVVIRNTPIEPIPDIHNPITPAATPTTGSGDTPGPLTPVNGTGTINVVAPPAPERPVTIVEHMPSFKGDLQTFFNKNIEYPQLEKDADIQGTVYLTFVVEKDGTISDVKILRGVTGGPGYTREALRLISLMPAWNPGQQNGHPVRVQMNLPIHFLLKND